MKYFYNLTLLLFIIFQLQCKDKKDTNEELGSLIALTSSNRADSSTSTSDTPNNATQSCKTLGTSCTNVSECCTSGVLGTLECQSGICKETSCPPSITSCVSGSINVCKNLETDKLNCGTCGLVCTSIQTCIAGACVP